MGDIPKNAKDILNDPKELEKFADISRITPEAAKALLERMLKEPEMSKAAEDFISSADRTDDFKAYTAGEEKGYLRGQEAGFAKGAVVGAMAVLGTMTVAGLTYLARSR
ncbi:hypothetical protein [Pseudoalteromonas gelatinilytica]|uniref:hypothetical protein n=1 Tax=Pseudoalteromonas gelatinilytica TaxID=1703256 RepID=UPI0007C4A1DA|nr:hypothetical protein [Pseudoalteromonas gelatinilytica]